MKRNKLMLALAVLLVFGLSGLSAVGMTVSWEWLLDDPDVTAYRYQLNGEEEDGWTVVSGDTDSYTAEGLDPYQSYTLYVQRSYDGVNWSESAASTAEAMLEEEPATVIEEPAEPVAVEESVAAEPDVITYQVLGFTAEFTVEDGKTTLALPSIVLESDVDGFFAYEVAKYGSAVDGIYYNYTGDSVELTYPETITRETVKANLPYMVEDIAEYAATLTAPAPVEETPATEEPAVTEESAVTEEPEVIAAAEPMGVTDRFAFTFIPRFGAGSYHDGTGYGPVIAQVGLGLDFGNILSATDSFGFGLRSDITADFIAGQGGDYWNLDPLTEYFNFGNYAAAGSIDLKLMFDVIGDDVMDFYFGGGVGYSIGHNKGPFDDILGLKSFNGIADDWFASGIVGLKFFTGDLFSIGAEAHYRYYMTSGVHYFSGDLVLGFTI